MTMYYIVTVAGAVYLAKLMMKLVDKLEGGRKNV